MTIDINSGNNEHVPNRKSFIFVRKNAQLTKYLILFLCLIIFALVIILLIYSASRHDYNYEGITSCQNLFFCLAIPLSSIFAGGFFIVIFVVLVANIYVDLKKKNANYVMSGNKY